MRFLSRLYEVSTVSCGSPCKREPGDEEYLGVVLSQDGISSAIDGGGIAGSVEAQACLIIPGWLIHIRNFRARITDY